MKTDGVVPEAISARADYKRKFNLREMYRAFVFLPGAVAKMIENNNKQLVDKNLVKRLQLAVTEVNGCAACSYQHAKMALHQGMSGEEISSFLSGGDEFIKPEEAKAILFAQHFADARGFPKKYAFDSIVKEYGESQADIVLSVVQIMLVGNIYGIPFSAFQSRLKGKPFKGSSLMYELGMLIAGVFLLPIALVHGMLRRLMGLSNRRLDKNTEQHEATANGQ